MVSFYNYQLLIRLESVWIALCRKATLCPPTGILYRWVSNSNFCQFSQKSFIRYPKHILFVYRIHISPINNLVSQSTTRYTYLFILYRLKSTLERAWWIRKVIRTGCHIFYLYKKMLTCVLTSCQMVRSIEPNPNKKRYSGKHLSMDSSRLSSTMSYQFMSAFTIPDTL